MGDRRPRLAPTTPSPKGELTASGNKQTLTAAGGMGGYGNMSDNEAYNQYLNFGWQLQAWAYYHSIGPLNYGMNWRANALSKVSLVIAEMIPGGKEPVPVEEGKAKGAVAILDQIKSDESQIMKRLSLQIDIPGRGYLIGRDIGKVREWCVYSPQQVRPVSARDRKQGIKYDYELWQDGAHWVPLDRALITVVREPDPCYSWLDTSNVQAALVTLREIDLYDKDIISSLVSRIANNGILLVPSEVSFPTREQFNDAEDPFMQELIEIARQSIKDPGSASAAIPMPLKVPSQFIDRFKHLILASGVDKTVLDARDGAYSILADTVNLPKEVMTGMGNVNHSAGLMEDLSVAAVSMHISPSAEVISRCLTAGFLYPQMIANKEPIIGPNGGKIVIWYDTSALTSTPNLSDKAIDLYDRFELSGEAVRRETGFSEDDAPDTDELKDQILKQAARQAQLALTALAELTNSTGVSRKVDNAESDGGVSETEDGTPNGVQIDVNSEGSTSETETVEV